MSRDAAIIFAIMASPSEPAHAAGRPGTAALPRPAPRLALVVAVARNGAIGLRNALPWRLPEDLRRFKALTLGHAVIMGRRTFESIGRPLAGRQNIVVTRERGYAAPGVEVAHSLEDALAHVGMPLPAFCIGGAGLFEAALPLAGLAHVTEIDADFEGDTFLQPLDPRQWREMARESHRHEGERAFDYAFVTYARTDAPTSTAVR